MTIKNGSEFKGLRKFNPEQLGEIHPLETAMVQEGVINNLEQNYNNHFQTRVNFMLQTPIVIARRQWNGTAFENRGNQNIITFGPWPATRLKNGQGICPIHIQAACATGGESLAASPDNSSNLPNPWWLATPQLGWRNFLIFEYLPYLETSAAPVGESASNNNIAWIGLGSTMSGTDTTVAWRNLTEHTLVERNALGENITNGANSLLSYENIPTIRHKNVADNPESPSSGDALNNCNLMVLNIYTSVPNPGRGSALPVAFDNGSDQTLLFQGLIVKEVFDGEFL